MTGDEKGHRGERRRATRPRYEHRRGLPSSLATSVRSVSLLSNCRIITVRAQPGSLFAVVREALRGRSIFIHRFSLRSCWLGRPAETSRHEETAGGGKNEEERNCVRTARITRGFARSDASRCFRRTVPRRALYHCGWSMNGNGEGYFSTRRGWDMVY